ncbi:MAG: hypothetical protein ACOX6V_05375 [Patescibacteria group bacterium]
MDTLTIKQARRVLGKDSQGVSDADLMRDIETATLLKDLFFDFHLKSRNQLAKKLSKVP